MALGTGSWCACPKWIGGYLIIILTTAINQSPLIFVKAHDVLVLNGGT